VLRAAPEWFGAAFLATIVRLSALADNDARQSQADSVPVRLYEMLPVGRNR
jgi:hypothetical protein